MQERIDDIEIAHAIAISWNYSFDEGEDYTGRESYYECEDYTGCESYYWSMS